MAANKAPEYVTLVSSDGFEFHVRRSCATVSGTIRRMLDPASNFYEARTGRCVLENINGLALEKVCEYFYYNEKHKNEKNVQPLELPKELLLELLMAADYLDTRATGYQYTNPNAYAHFARRPAEERQELGIASRAYPFNAI